MVIRFKIDIEDVVQFNRRRFDHSPTFKRNKIKFLSWVSALLIGGSLIIPLPESIPRSASVVYAVAWVLVVSLFMLLVGPASMDRAVRIHFSEGKNKGTICEHELEINERELIERTEVNETRHFWRGVERIVQIESYTFIDVSANSGHIIPKKSVITGDFDRFTARAKELWRSATQEDAT